VHRHADFSSSRPSISFRYLSDIAPRVPGRIDFPTGPTIGPVAKVNATASGRSYVRKDGLGLCRRSRAHRF
jgi:hypothetical protein